MLTVFLSLVGRRDLDPREHRSTRVRVMTVLLISAGETRIVVIDMDNVFRYRGSILCKEVIKYI